MFVIAMLLIACVFTACSPEVRYIGEEEIQYNKYTTALNLVTPTDLSPSDLAAHGITWNTESNVLTLHNAYIEVKEESEYCILLPAGSTIAVEGTNYVIGNYSYDYDDDIAGIYAKGDLTIKGSNNDSSKLIVKSGKNTCSADGDDAKGQCNGIFVEKSSSSNLTISNLTLTSVGGTAAGNRSVGIYCYGDISISNSCVDVSSEGATADYNHGTYPFDVHYYGIGYGIYRNGKLLVKDSTVNANINWLGGFSGAYFNGIYGLTSDMSSTTVVTNSNITTYSFATTKSDLTANDFAFSCSDGLLLYKSTLVCKTNLGKSLLLTSTTPSDVVFDMDEESTVVIAGKAYLDACVNIDNYANSSFEMRYYSDITTSTDFTTDSDLVKEGYYGQIGLSPIEKQLSRIVFKNGTVTITKKKSATN